MKNLIQDISTQVVHYGANSFNPEKFRPIENVPFFSKPNGGLWTSPKNAEYSWHQFCIENNYELPKLLYNFEFIYTGKTVVIDSANNLDELPMKTIEKLEINGVCHEIKQIDFEVISNTVDAIHLTENGLRETSRLFLTDDNTYTFYGWDCECILIMNPNTVAKCAL